MMRLYLGQEIETYEVNYLNIHYQTEGKAEVQAFYYMKLTFDLC